MATTNHPENQQPQGGATDLGQISTKTYGPDNPPRLRKQGESVEEYRKAMGWKNTPSQSITLETLKQNITFWLTSINDDMDRIEQSGAYYHYLDGKRAGLRVALAELDRINGEL